MIKQDIKEKLLDQLKQEHCFWSYNEESIEHVSDSILIEKTLLQLYPFKKIKQVWLEYLIPQEEYLYTLNRFLAWYYFKIKKPDAYLKSMITRHYHKLFA